MSLGHRIYDWIFNQHGVHRLSREQREADEQGVVKKDAKNRCDVARGGFVTHRNPIIIFDEVPLMQAMSAEEGPKYKEGEWVEVHSKVYGRWIGRVESRQHVGDHFRYTIVSDGLLPYFQPRGSYRNLHRRHVLVPEVILERYEPPAAPTGSQMAADLTWMNSALRFTPHPTQERFFSNGLWGFTDPVGSMEDLKAWAKEHGKDWIRPSVHTEFLMRAARVSYEDQEKRQRQSQHAEIQDSLHREFLLTIDHVINVIGDKEFGEKMRSDLLGLWHEDKVAKGLTAPQALGMTADQYSAWVEKKESSQ